MRSLSLIIIVLLSISFFSFPLVNSSSYSTNSSDFNNKLMSEEENVDSFDVHPANRWDITNDASDVDVLVVNNSVIYFSDKGDGSVDIFRMIRVLRDLDGKIEFRYKTASNATLLDYRNSLHFSIKDEDDNLLFWYVHSTSSISSSVELIYADINGVYRSTYLIGSEDLIRGEWFTVRIDYDKLKSSFRIRCYDDDDLNKFDYYITDLAHYDNYYPKFFNAMGFSVQFSFNSYENTVVVENYLDYILAPFKEREWEQIADPSSQFYVDQPFGVRVEDNAATDVSQYQLTIPYLDYFSGEATIYTSDNEVFCTGATQDEFKFTLTVYSVNASNGYLDQVLSMTMVFEETTPSNLHTRLTVASKDDIQYRSFNTLSSWDIMMPLAVFSIHTVEDRGSVILDVVYYPNDSDLDDINTFQIEQDCYSSQEFVIDLKYDVIQLNSDVELFCTLDKVDMIVKDIFGDIGGFIGDVVGGGLDIFDTLFKWLGSMIAGAFGVVGEALGNIFQVVGDALSTAFGVVGDAIGVAFGVVGDLIIAAFETVGDIIVSAVDLVTSAIDTMVAVLSDLLDDIIAGLGEIAIAIIELLIEFAADIAEAMVDGLILISGLLVELFVAVLDAILGALGLQGLADSIAEIFSNLITSFIAILVAIPDMVIFVFDVVTFLGWYLLIALWAYVLIISIGTSDNYLEWLSEIQAKLNSSFPEFSILGFSMSIKLYMILLPLTIVEVNAI